MSGVEEDGMTRQQFYKELKKTRTKFIWKVTWTGTIRGKLSNRYFCPITAVLYAKTGRFLNLNLAGTAFIKLDMFFAHNIVLAADKVAFTHDRRIRRSLLRALGLKEKP